MHFSVFPPLTSERVLHFLEIQQKTIVSLLLILKEARKMKFAIAIIPGKDHIYINQQYLRNSYYVVSANQNSEAVTCM